MDTKPRWYELVERAKNFHGDYELFQKQVIGNEVFFTELHMLHESIIVDLDKTYGKNSEQILKTLFESIYDFVAKGNEAFAIFGENTRIHDNVFEACFFTTLCMFIHGSKRIKGVSLRRFLYEHSPYQYNIKGLYDVKRSKFYFDYEYPEKDSLGFKFIGKEEAALRQMRYRLLSTRATYDKQPEWSALRMDSEYEWAFLYVLNNLDKGLLDIYKRIGNLYNDINTALHVFKTSPKDKEHYYRLEDAFKKFSSKLKKINYARLLELQKKILLYICENKSHYGMNIYRFERQLRLHNITSEVKRLLESKEEAEENNIIKRSVILNDLHFPKLYQDFAALTDPRYTAFCSNMFYLFIDVVVGSSRLIIDELVENNFFGEDWEKIFLDIINEMTERVFYDPKKIDYTVAPGSQEKFTKVISNPVCDLLYRNAGLTFP